MFKNYLTIAYRNFRRNGLYSFITVAGLAIGLSASILIFLYVSDEMSYDAYHSKSERIYRVNEYFEANDGSGERSASLPFPVPETLAGDHPHLIEHFVRLFNFQSPSLTVAYEPLDKEFNERFFFFTDSTYHQVFDLNLIQGNKETALNNPNSVIISQAAATKYFENEEPLGKLIRFQGNTDLMVTGVMQDMPLNSHFRADFLASFSTLRQFYGGQYPQGWFWNPCWTYVLLTEPAQPKELIDHFPDFVQKHFPANIKHDVTLHLQPLNDIHLKSHLDFEINQNGNEANIYLFSGVAVFVLLIACINFMNLSTARSMSRAKEVGMRKVIGGSRRQLIAQFMGESILISFLALVIALIIVFVSLPWFNEFSQKAVALNLLSPEIYLTLVAIGLGVGFISGIYPAIVLTSFNPIAALKTKHSTRQGLAFRRILVVSQFTISVLLIIGTGVAIKQLNFLQTSDVGFQKDHIIMVPVMRIPAFANQYLSFTQEALRHKDIHSITTLEEILGSKYQTANYRFEGMDRESLYARLNVRHDFLQTFNIPLLAGRDYSIDIPTDDSLALVVNETLVRGLGWTPTEAIGKPFYFGNYKGEIVGVAKDFNFTSKHAPIGPLVLHLSTNPGAFNLFLKYMAVRIAPQNAQAAIGHLEKMWADMVPAKPFEFFFLENELNNLYKTEGNISKVMGAFTILAMIVACLGLFGLASYTAEQRKKEIGIRKVLGSSVNRILVQMYVEYGKLLFAAVLISGVVGYFALDSWLSTFAYHIKMPLPIFILAPLVTIVVAMLTVSYKTLSAANSNPIDVLKEE